MIDKLHDGRSLREKRPFRSAGSSALDLRAARSRVVREGVERLGRAGSEGGSGHASVRDTRRGACVARLSGQMGAVGHTDCGFGGIDRCAIDGCCVGLDGRAGASPPPSGTAVGVVFLGDGVHGRRGSGELGSGGALERQEVVNPGHAEDPRHVLQRSFVSRRTGLHSRRIRGILEFGGAVERGEVVGAANTRERWNLRRPARSIGRVVQRADRMHRGWHARLRAR